jgi:anti-sigma B factor antagonist
MSEETLHFSTTHGIVVMELTGSLDMSIIPGLKVRITERLTEHPLQIVVDLKQVSYLDSSGIGLLIFIAKLAHEYKGAVQYVVPTGFVFDVLHMVHFDTLFAVHKSRDRAIKSFGTE